MCAHVSMCYSTCKHTRGQSCVSVKCERWNEAPFAFVVARTQEFGRPRAWARTKCVSTTSSRIANKTLTCTCMAAVRPRVWALEGVGATQNWRQTLVAGTGTLQVACGQALKPCVADEPRAWHLVCLFRDVTRPRHRSTYCAASHRMCGTYWSATPRANGNLCVLTRG